MLHATPHLYTGIVSCTIMLALFHLKREIPNKAITPLLRSFSTIRGNQKGDNCEREGAWTILAALEKAKEARGLRVAKLVSSLEAILPMSGAYSFLGGNTQQQHTTSNQYSHSTDPVFFSLPHAAIEEEDPNKWKITGNDIRQLLQATRRGRRIDIHTIVSLVKAATERFKRRPQVVTALPPLTQHQQLTVIGDLHGSLSDLEAVLELTGEPNEQNLLLFNGDLADRGDHGIEVICIVCALSLAYPDFVHVNRGNHEDLTLSIAYGLASEVQFKYGAIIYQDVLSPLMDTFFCSLPLATVVEKDALIVHAGPPPPGIMLGDIVKYMEKDNGLSRTIRTKSDATNIPEERAQEVIESLLWSDPDYFDDRHELLADSQSQSKTNRLLSGWVPNRSRGAGFKYDSEVVRNLLSTEGLFRFVRSHEPVRRGCARYVIQNSEGATTSNTKQQPMEFFTVFSASRYPHKEGFNQGAVLKLKWNGQHSVVRYSTEEDEASVDSSFTTFDDANPASLFCEVDSTSLRRALRDAIASHKSELVNAFQTMTQKHKDGIPFEEAIDVLIRTIQLDKDCLQTSGARLALAKALSIQCHDTLPHTIDLLHCMDELFGNQNVENSSSTSPYYPWLHAVFELVDVNHNGRISRSEWLGAVASINSKLPPGTTTTTAIDAHETWDLLDLNGDGEVTLSEWDDMGKYLPR